MLIFAPTLGWSLASALVPANAVLALCILFLCLIVRRVFGALQMGRYRRRKGVAVDGCNNKDTAPTFDPARAHVQGQAVTEVAERNAEETQV